jgi:predicted component of type VI protein secretion system
MAEFEYGLGGTERPIDASEAFADLPQNKTLIIQKLTAEDALSPRVVEGLTNVEAVFAHFKPKVEATFTGADGSQVNEELSFTNVGDFGPKGLTRQSKFLQDLSEQQSELLRVVKQLRSNKRFVSAMQDPAAKTAVIEALKELANDLGRTK